MWQVKTLSILQNNGYEEIGNQLASGIKEKLASVTLLSDEVRSLMDQRDKPWKNTPDKKTEYIKGLYFEESFEEVKGNLEKLVSQILENEDHQLKRWGSS